VDGREVVLELIDAPDFFGTLAVIKGFPYPANAIAMEDCEVGKIKREIFLQIFNKYPVVTQSVAASYHYKIKIRN